MGATISFVFLQEFYGDYIAVSPHIFSFNIVGAAKVSSG